MEKFLNKKYLKKYLSDNKWLIIVAILFIVWKFFLIGVLWNNRNIPPVPDDSYLYINNIESVKSSPFFLSGDENQYYSIKNYTGFTYLSYRLLGGVIGKTLNINSDLTYKYIFYIGIIILVFSLIYFLKIIEKDRKIIAFSLFFLALFNGVAYYHGFWWVVPSFFSTILFFLTLGVIFDKDGNYYKTKLILLSLLTILTHPIGIYINISILLLGFFCWLLKLENKKIIIRRIFFTFFCSLIIYSPLAIYLDNSRDKNPYGPENFLLSQKERIFNQSKSPVKESNENKNIPANNLTGSSNNEKHVDNSLKNEKPSRNLLNSEKHENKLPVILTDNKNNTASVTSSNETLSDWSIVKKYYFSWIFFPFYLGFPIFLFIIFILFYYKKKEILSIYLYLLSLILLATLSKYGSRLLVLLWPITYVVLAFGIICTQKIIKEKIKKRVLQKITRLLMCIFIFIFVFINLVFSYLWNDYINKLANQKIDKDFIAYIKSEDIYKNEDGILFFNSKTALTLGLYENLSVRKVASSSSQAKYFIATTCSDISEEIKKTRLFQLFTFLRNSIPGFSERSSIDNESSNEDCNGDMPNDFIFQKKFGDVLIYKRK